MKKRVTFTLSEVLIKELKEYSNESMIPQARIVESALIEYLKKKQS